MNKTIWKFELATTEDQTIEIPVGSEILTIQTQNGIPCVWVLVDPSEEKEQILIEIYGTGSNIEDSIMEDRRYIGTYQLNGGSLVFHVFQRNTY